MFDFISTLPAIAPSPLYNAVFYAVLLAAVVTVLTLFIIDAPYGRHERTGWGITLPATPAWVLMESPSAVLFAYWFFTGAHAWHTAPLILAGMWLLHYVHRTFIYPFTLGSGPKERMPLLVVASGFVFNSANAFLNATFLSRYAEHLTHAWLTHPLFWLGCAVFVLGFVLNKYSDHLLRELGKRSNGEYRIPYGGAFRWVSMPNYLGEILTWTGFAIAAWSPAGALFVVFTMANLVPRALSNHRWYKEKFPDYPKERKAIFPFVL